MSTKKFLHELPDIKAFFEETAYVKRLLEQLVEKDYWIMHCLWGLQSQGFHFELKGGTSLSKGFGIIDRFSEDIDIKIDPPHGMDVKAGKNQDKPNHRKSRLEFFDWLVEAIKIPGIKTERDTSFDDQKARNGGIRLIYDSLFDPLPGIKTYVLLEVGFDLTTPNEKRTISSWAYDDAVEANLKIEDSRAADIPCYLPGYTFVEKLSAILGKFQKEQTGEMLPVNFIRHYYDIYKLLQNESVLNFIGTAEYHEHKKERFRKNEPLDLRQSDAFLLSDPETRRRYSREYERTKALYYSEFPSFETVLEQIKSHLHRL